MIITEYGQEAIAAATAGKTVISFTALKTTNSRQINQTSDGKRNFATIVQSISPSRIDFNKSLNTVVVSGLFSNEGLGQAYTILGVGIYAKCAGEYEQTVEALFAYDFFDTGDYMPLPTDFPQSYSYQFNTKITDSDTVNITIEPGTYAPAADLQALAAVVEEFKPKTIRIRCNNTAATTEKAGYNFKQEVSIPGITADYWVYAQVTSGSYLNTYQVEPAADKAILWFVTQPASNVYITITYMKTEE